MQEDLRAACLADPKAKDVREAYEAAKQALAAHKRDERQAFGGIFSRVE